MDVHNSVAKCREKVVGNQPEETCQNQVRSSCFPEPLEDGSILKFLPGKNPGSDVEVQGTLKGESVCVVAQQHDHLDIGVMGEASHDGLCIGAAAGGKQGEADTWVVHGIKIA